MSEKKQSIRKLVSKISLVA